MNPSVALPHQQSSLFQNAKMLRHRRQRHLERLRQLADGPLPECEAGEDRASCRIAEGGEGGVERIVIVNQLV